MVYSQSVYSCIVYTAHLHCCSAFESNGGETDDPEVGALEACVFRNTLQTTLCKYLLCTYLYICVQIFTHDILNCTYMHTHILMTLDHNWFRASLLCLVTVRLALMNAMYHTSNCHASTWPRVYLAVELGLFHNGEDSTVGLMCWVQWNPSKADTIGNQQFVP